MENYSTLSIIGITTVATIIVVAVAIALFFGILGLIARFNGDEETEQ